MDGFVFIFINSDDIMQKANKEHSNFFIITEQFSDPGEHLNEQFRSSAFVFISYTYSGYSFVLKMGIRSTMADTGLFKGLGGIL